MNNSQSEPATTSSSMPSAPGSPGEDLSWLDDPTLRFVMDDRPVLDALARLREEVAADAAAQK